MFDFMGWYEVVTLSLIGGAYWHGTLAGKKDHMTSGVEMALEALEKQGVIRVCPETGEILGIAKPE